MMDKEERGRVPDLILEQFALGELPAREEERLRAAMASDPSILRRLEEIDSSNAKILDEHPAANMAASIRSRLEASAPSAEADALLSFHPSPGARTAAALSRRAILPAAAAFLVLAGAFAMRGVFTSPASDLEITRAKGGEASLHVYRKTSSGSEELADGELAARSDLLQLRYSSGGARYGAILSIDGRGSVTFHLPPSYSGGSGESPQIDSRPGTALDSAYELDDAPSFERFFLVISERPFALEEVLDDARKLAARGDAASAPLPLGSRLDQSSFLVRKGGSPR